MKQTYPDANLVHCHQNFHPLKTGLFIVHNICTGKNKTKIMTMDNDSFVSISSEFVLKLALTNEASPTNMPSKQIRRVRLHEIFNPDQDSRPSYVKLVERVAFFFNLDVDKMVLVLTYRDEENDSIHVSSSVELEHAIQQYSNNSSSMKFEGTAANSQTVWSSTQAADCGGCIIPSDLRVKYPKIRFDPNHAAAGVQFSGENRVITQTTQTCSRKCVYATESFSSGCHYWSFQVTNNAANGSIMIGVSSGKASVTASVYPGHANDPSGCSLHLNSGNFYRSGTSVSVPAPELVKKASKVGVLLNMDDKTVSFYADGKRVGTGAGSDILTANEYYPVVALFELGSSVTIEDIET